MQKRGKNNKGFESLLSVHTNALEENSKSIVEILEILTDKELSVKDKKALKKIKRSLSLIDDELDNLDSSDSQENEESWWE